MSDSTADGTSAVPLVAGADGASADIVWVFDHGRALADAVDAHLLALADEGLPIDMLLAGADLVRVERPHDEPFFSDDEIGDWAGTAYDAPRLQTLGGQAYDLVIGGSYAENVHMLPDHPAFAGWEDGPAMSPGADILVDLGDVMGESIGAPYDATDSRGASTVADLQVPQLSWLADAGSSGTHVEEVWAWDDEKGAYVFHHFA